MKKFIPALPLKEDLEKLKHLKQVVKNGNSEISGYLRFFQTQILDNSFASRVSNIIEADFPAMPIDCVCPDVWEKVEIEIEEEVEDQIYNHIDYSTIE